MTKITNNKIVNFVKFLDHFLYLRIYFKPDSWQYESPLGALNNKKN